MDNEISKYAESYDEYAKKLGIHFRRPKWFLPHLIQISFSNFKLARWIMGGKWQSFVHDIGTGRAIISWHWMQEFKHGDSETFRYEEYR